VALLGRQGARSGDENNGESEGGFGEHGIFPCGLLDPLTERFS
jgi:hypothetical protein